MLSGENLSQICLLLATAPPPPPTKDKVLGSTVTCIISAMSSTAGIIALSIINYHCYSYHYDDTLTSPERLTVNQVDGSCFGSAVWA